MRNACGSRTIARPIATRCRCPPESVRGFFFRIGSSPSTRAASFTRRPISAFGNDAHLQAEGHVVVGRHVRIERVVLEHHRDVAVLRRQVVDDAARRSGRRPTVIVLEPRDHAERGRLAAARRPDEHDELAVVDLQVRSETACVPSA